MEEKGKKKERIEENRGMNSDEFVFFWGGIEGKIVFPP